MNGQMAGTILFLCMYGTISKTTSHAPPITNTEKTKRHNISNDPKDKSEDDLG